MAYSKEDKNLLLELLEKHDFQIKPAVLEYRKQTKHKLQRKSVYEWFENDDFFKKEFDMRKAELLDEAEHAHRLLRQGIPLIDEDTGEIIAWQEKPDRAAIEFFLKSKGKERGYEEVNRTDITSKGESINGIKKISFKNTTTNENDI